MEGGASAELSSHHSTFNRNLHTSVYICYASVEVAWSRFFCPIIYAATIATGPGRQL